MMIVFAQIVAVVGGDERDVELALHLEEGGVDCFSGARPWSWISRKKLPLPKMSW